MSTVMHARKGQRFDCDFGAYTADSNGLVTVDDRDVVAMMRSGCTLSNITDYPKRIALSSGKNSDATALKSSAPAAGAFVISSSLGTSLAMLGHDVTGTTLADVALFETVLPDWFSAGADLTMTVEADYTGTGTKAAATVDASARKVAANGTEGADLVTTNPQNLSTAMAALAFQIDGRTLNPGDDLVLSVTTSVHESGGTNALTAGVASIVLG